MPRVNADQLTRIGNRLLVKAGVSAHESEIVVSHLVDANLVGHDSHGIMLLPTYIDRVYDPARAERRMGFRCRTDFAAVLAALREGRELPFAHDPSYVSPKEIG